MSQNHYQTVEYYPSSQPSNASSPMHNHPESAKSVQVLDISHPVLYSPFDGRNYPAIVKKESVDERSVWPMEHCDKIVGINQDLNISVKTDPEWHKRDCNMESSWMTSMEVNKLPYDIGNRCSDPKVPSNDIPISPYLQVAERFVSELSNERPKTNTFGDSSTDVDGVSVGISMSPGLLSPSVVQMIRSDTLTEDSSSLSINSNSKPSTKQRHEEQAWSTVRLLMVDESLVPSHYSDGLYTHMKSAVNTPVITGSHLGQMTDLHSSHNLSQASLHPTADMCHTPDMRRTPDLHHNPDMCQTPNLSHPSSVGQTSDLSRSTDLSHDMHENSSLDESVGSSRNHNLSVDTASDKMTCDHCDKAFPTKHKLSLHKRTHRKKSGQSMEGDKVGAAPGIGGGSGSGERGGPLDDGAGGGSAGAGAGAEKRGSQEDLPFVCPACGRGFRMKMALACHMRYHAEERSYNCTDCGQAFTSRWARSPQLCDKCKHGPCAKPVPKPCKCDRCGKCFKDARLLRDHTRSHTGERPFVCPTCGKTFAQSGTLYRHKQVHSDSRPYRCSQCNKSYKLKGHLTVHMKSHTP